MAEYVTSIKPGLIYGRLTVLCKVGFRGRHALWRCRCRCGKDFVARADKLKDGRQQSCGCLRKEQAGRLHAERLERDAQRRQVKIARAAEKDAERQRVRQAKSAARLADQIEKARIRVIKAASRRTLSQKETERRIEQWAKKMNELRPVGVEFPVNPQVDKPVVNVNL